MSTTIFGKFEKLAVGLRGGQSDIDSYLRIYIPSEPLNAGGVNDGAACPGSGAIATLSSRRRSIVAGAFTAGVSGGGNRLRSAFSCSPAVSMSATVGLAGSVGATGRGSGAGCLG